MLRSLNVAQYCQRVLHGRLDGFGPIAGTAEENDISHARPSDGRTESGPT